MSNQFHTSLQYLRQKNIKVQNEWVEACLEWLISENQGNPIPQSKLKELIYEQWLMADLSDISEPCLPSEQLKGQGPGSVTGDFMLQVNYIVNISESAFSQYQKLKGLEIDDTVEGPETKNKEKDTKWKFKASRMLFLQLTDGYTKVDAVEYHPIGAFDAKIDPGCKIRLSGNISYFDGLLLLKRENVSILGGNAEELMNKFSTATLLKATLGIVDDDPPGNSREGTHGERGSRGTDGTKEEGKHENNPVAASTDLLPLSDSEDIFDDVLLPDFGNEAEISNSGSRGMVATERHSEGRHANEAVQRHQPKNPPNRGQNSTINKNTPQLKWTNTVNTPNSFDVAAFDDDFDDFDVDLEGINNIEEEKILKQSSSKLRSSDQSKFYADIEEFSSENVEGQELTTTTGLRNRNPKVPDQSAKEKFMTLSDVISTDHNETQFTIKGRVSSLLTQLRTFPSYHLKVAVNDGTASSEATIDPKVITKLIGYTANELEGFKIKHPRVRETVKQAVLNSQRKLAASLWIMDITKIEGEQKVSYKIVDMKEVT